MHNRISIKWGFFLYFSFFSLIMLLILWIFQVLFLDEFYRIIKINEIKSYSSAVAKNVESIIRNNDNFMPDHDICMSVFDENGKLVYASDVTRACMIHKIPSQILYSITKKYLAGGTEYINQFNDPKPQLDNFKLKASIPRNVFYSKQISTEEGASYLIVLNSSIAPVNATVTTLRTQLIYITMIMLLLSFALSIRISKNISDPIIEINNKSKLFAKGEYDVSFEEKGYLEIAELAQTLNYSAKELSKVENLRRELIANISHDLRTPLTMIIGYSEVIRDLPNENTPENVQVIIDEAKRLASLVNDVLDISKLQSGSQKLNKTEFNLTKTIEDILTRYAKFTEKDGYTIKFEKDTDFIVTADELRITQVIYNLINNAITYTGPDKSVTIRQTVTDGKVKIEVIDTGEGIAPENIPYIWDRYYKVNDSHKRAQIGTGLGLSIVKGILEMHNAQFGVESKVGMGSTFWFIL